MSSRPYSSREKMLGTLMMGVVSTFLLQRFVVAPYQTRLNELETIKARKERQLRRIRSILVSRKEIEVEYVRRFGNRTGARPLPGEMSTFLKNIEKLARGKNVRIRDIRPTRNDGETLSAGFVTESTWPSLAGLLISLEDRRVVIEKITLTRSSPSSPGMKAQIQLTQES